MNKHQTKKYTGRMVNTEQYFSFHKKNVPIFQSYVSKYLNSIIYCVYALIIHLFAIRNNAI